MSKDRSKGECLLERVECIMIRGVELSGNIFLGKVLWQPLVKRPIVIQTINLKADIK